MDAIQEKHPNEVAYDAWQTEAKAKKKAWETKAAKHKKVREKFFATLDDWEIWDELARRHKEGEQQQRESIESDMDLFFDLPIGTIKLCETMNGKQQLDNLIKTQL